MTLFRVVGMVATQEEINELSFISKIAVTSHRFGLLGSKAKVLMDGGILELPNEETETIT